MLLGLPGEQVTNGDDPGKHTVVNTKKNFLTMSGVCTGRASSCNRESACPRGSTIPFPGCREQVQISSRAF